MIRTRTFGTGMLSRIYRQEIRAYIDTSWTGIRDRNNTQGLWTGVMVRIYGQESWARNMNKNHGQELYGQGYPSSITYNCIFCLAIEKYWMTWTSQRNAGNGINRQTDRHTDIASYRLVEWKNSLVIDYMSNTERLFKCLQEATLTSGKMKTTSINASIWQRER